jgi:hypothetical protein
MPIRSAATSRSRSAYQQLEKRRKKMLEKDVIGHNHWTRGFLCEADVKYLEAIDSVRSRNLSSSSSSGEASSYEQMVEEDALQTPRHCEHGVPLYERCAMCRGFIG